MQGIGRRRHPGHRHRIVPGGPETGNGGTGFPDQPTDPGKRRIAGPTLEDGTGAEAPAVEDSKSPQVDRGP